MTTPTDPVSRFLDATIPNWRLEAHGPGAISAHLSGWYADPGRLSEVTRSPLSAGELGRWDASLQAEIEEGLVTAREGS